MQVIWGRQNREHIEESAVEIIFTRVCVLVKLPYFCLRNTVRIPAGMMIRHVQHLTSLYCLSSMEGEQGKDSGPGFASVEPSPIACHRDRSSSFPLLPFKGRGPHNTEMAAD